MAIRNKKPNRNGLVKSDYSKLKTENKELKERIEELEKQLSIHGVVNRRELLCDDCNKQSKYIAVLCKECYLKDSEL